MRIKKSKSKNQDASYDSGVAKSVASIVLMAIAVVSFLSIVGSAGVVGTEFNTYLEKGTGWGTFVLPILLLLMAGALLLFAKHRSMKHIFWGGVVVFVCLMGVFAGMSSEDMEHGGYIGYGVAYFPIQFLGATASSVLFFAAACIALILGLNISLPHLLASLWERYRGREEDEEEDEEEVDEDRILEQQKRPVDASHLEQQDIKTAEEPKESKLIDTPSLTTGDGGDTPFHLPPFDLLVGDSQKPASGDIKANAFQIQKTLYNFGIEVDVGEVSVGPTVTQYTFKPKEGTKLSRITALSNDLALALAAEALRIEAPIPGKSLVGIEVPNKVKTVVRLRNLVERQEFRNVGSLPIALGRDVSGKAMYADLAKMPHLLIAGSTGSGKTIALTSVIVSLLYKNTPDQLKMILVDPKRVEFTVYANIPHLLAPVVTESSKAVNALKWGVSEMERRFDLLSRVGSRDIISYHKNRKALEEHGPLPYLVIIIDELADLMSAKGKEVEALVVRIAQLARAAGIHLILATQRPSVEVITGTIKANLPARMAFQVASQIDSRTILDTAGAEKLIGKGDMLFLGPQDSKPVRIQGTFLDDAEVKKVADHLRQQVVTPDESSQEGFEGSSPSSSPPSPQQSSVDLDDIDASAEDDMYNDAKEVVIRSQKASASLLQRRLRVGYARAARLLDLLEENGVIGPADGSRPREVFVKEESPSQEDL